MVMAHWRLKPQEVKKLSFDDLELMEFSYLMYERRLSETLDNLIGSNLGTSWPMSILDKEKDLTKDVFTWSLRKREPKVNLPLTLALTQNPKFMEEIKKAASDLKMRHRRDPSVLSLPKGDLLKGSEVIDLSTVSKEEFLQIAGRVSTL